MMVYTYEGDTAHVTFVWRPGDLASGRRSVRTWLEDFEPAIATKPGEWERAGMTSRKGKSTQAPVIEVRDIVPGGKRCIGRLRKALIGRLESRIERNFGSCEVVWLT